MADDSLDVAASNPGRKLFEQTASGNMCRSSRKFQTEEDVGAADTRASGPPHIALWTAAARREGCHRGLRHFRGLLRGVAGASPASSAVSSVGQAPVVLFHKGKKGRLMTGWCRLRLSSTCRLPSSQEDTVSGKVYFLGIPRSNSSRSWARRNCRAWRNGHVC